MELMATALSLVMVEQEVRRCAAMAGCRNTLLLPNRNMESSVGSGFLFKINNEAILLYLKKICFTNI